jgi:hypothetical protein
VFIAKIFSEFILGLVVLHAHDASGDLGCCVLQLDEAEMPSQHSRMQPCLSPQTKVNRVVVLAQCGRVTTVQQEGPSGVVGILARLGSKATC